ncbi:MAG: hypothetical protein ACF8Q5_10310 [Phycisphaerales bacterium JB040]
MARFVIEQTVTDQHGPDWATLAQWTMDGRSVELVGVRQPDGAYHIEVRRWTGLRDDTDPGGNKSNSQKAAPTESYRCR